MDPLSEQLAVDSRTAFKFFWECLTEEISEESVEESEKLYVASMLAHYALTSCYSITEAVSAPISLDKFFDLFVLDRSELGSEPEIYEIGGSWSLMLTGFFLDQVPPRANVRWYKEIGQGLYLRASQSSNDRDRSALLERIATSFVPWTFRLQRVSRTLRENQDNRYLLRLN